MRRYRGFKARPRNSLDSGAMHSGGFQKGQKILVAGRQKRFGRFLDIRTVTTRNHAEKVIFARDLTFSGRLRVQADIMAFKQTPDRAHARARKKFGQNRVKAAAVQARGDTGVEGELFRQGAFPSFPCLSVGPWRDETRELGGKREAPFAAFPRVTYYYFAKPTALRSRMTVTRICPG